MITAQDVWSALDSLARERGLTPSGLARAAGLDATAFNPSRRGTDEGRARWLSLGSLLRALAVLDTPLSTFAAGLEKRPFAPQGGEHALEPVVGGGMWGLPLSHLGQEGLFDRYGVPTGSAWEQMDCPFNLPAPAYVVRIDTDLCEPVLREGASVVLLPGLAVRAQDRVLLVVPGEVPCVGIMSEYTPSVILPFDVSSGEGRPVPEGEGHHLHRIVMTTA
ncbi:MAG: helix-turn-helix transcriptional regulator [Acetobacter papayae]